MILLVALGVIALLLLYAAVFGVGIPAQLRGILFMVALILALGALLSACASPPPSEPIVTVKEANVAVATPCKTKLGDDPFYPDSAAALAAVPHPGAEARLKANPADSQALADVAENVGYQLGLLLQGRVMRVRRLAEYAAARQGCEGT